VGIQPDQKLPQKPAGTIKKSFDSIPFLGKVDKALFIKDKRKQRLYVINAEEIGVNEAK